MNLLWLDLETTGLDPMKHDILEIGMVVTDDSLNVLESLNIVLAQQEEALGRMDQWCWTTHTQSGLVDAVRNSDTTMFDAKILMSVFLTMNFPNTKPVLHGNSIHFDKKFIDLHMPEISEMLHYRLMDVSSWKEWFKTVGFSYKAQFPSNHRALDDIRGSIEEFKYYSGVVKKGLDNMEHQPNG